MRYAIRNSRCIVRTLPSLEQAIDVRTVLRILNPDVEYTITPQSDVLPTTQQPHE